MKSHARVAVIGGGVTGCSILYHLAKAGWRDAVLLERSELTSGSTWHAAGGTSALTGSANMSTLHKYSFELYPKIEQETGQSCGFHPVGRIALARTEARVEEIKILKAKARRVGLDPVFLSNEEAMERAPILDLSGVRAVLFDPAAGHVDPSGVTQAFAAGARLHGAEIYRQCPVIKTNPRPDGSWEVVTAQGSVVAEHIVNAAGLWAREVAALAGAWLPLMPVEHHYFVTENIPVLEELDHEIPMIGDADAEFYMRQEGKGLLLGAYENTCTHWSEHGTPADFGHELLADDLDRIERNLTQAVESIPVLGTAGIKRVVNGPMIFSPDLNPLIGPYPGLRNYWCACGVMTAFSQAGAVGMLLTNWMTEDDPGLDVFMWDVTRFGPWAGKSYTRARTADMYSTRFKTIYPYEDRQAGRPVKTTPIFEVQKARGAVFGANYGLEYPLWYAADGKQQADNFTFRRPNWFESVGEECRALRSGVGLLEVSTYAKYRISGPKAESWLDHVLANTVPREAGLVVLRPVLNPRGRLVGDFTVSRLGDEEFFLVGSGAMERFHLRWWDQWLPADGVVVESLTPRWVGFNIAGPKARTLLERLCDVDVSGDAFPFLTAQPMEVGPVREAVVLRISFTGELGYEMFFPPEYQRPLLAAIEEAGEDLGLRLVGSRALASLRIEKSFPSWGAELSPDYSPFDACLDRFVKLDKTDFVGRDAALRLKQQEPAYRLTAMEVDAEDADAWGGEPVLRDGEYVGYVSSAAFGHCAGKSLALGYLKSDVAREAGDLSIELVGESRGVRTLAEAAVDPKGDRMRD
ncbi:MAG: FAD-dependent oxidoreductase [Proteobacteria bacterium]|nr:FAD-dependent oxidoreductase [Pseudomonadota bacterium]